MNKDDLEATVERLLSQRHMSPGGGVDPTVKRISEDQKIFADFTVPWMLLDEEYDEEVKAYKNHRVVTPTQLSDLNPNTRIAEINRFLNATECDALLSELERHDFMSLANLYSTDERTSQRLLFRSPPLARSLYKRLMQCGTHTGGKRFFAIQPMIAGCTHWTPRGINPVFKVSRYQTDEEFKPHYDAPYCRSHGLCTGMTVLIYLSNIPASQGGATQFYLPGENAGKSMGDLVYECQPQMGKVLMFTQNVLHAGAPVLGTTPKIVLRCDLEYECDFVDKPLAVTEEMRAINEQYERALLLRVLNQNPTKFDVDTFTRMHVDALYRHMKVVTEFQVRESSCNLHSLGPLSVDALNHVFQYLSLRHFVAMSSVSKMWCRVVRDPSRWEALFLSRWPRNDVISGVLGFSYYHQYVQRHVMDQACPVVVIDVADIGKLSVGYSATSPPTIVRDLPAVWGQSSMYGGHGCYYASDVLIGVQAEYPPSHVYVESAPVKLYPSSWLSDDYVHDIIEYTIRHTTQDDSFILVFVLPPTDDINEDEVTALQRCVFQQRPQCMGIVWMDAIELATIGVDRIPSSYKADPSLAVIVVYECEETLSVSVMVGGQRVDTTNIEYPSSPETMFTSILTSLPEVIPKYYPLAQHIVMCLDRKHLLADDSVMEHNGKSVHCVARDVACVRGGLAASMMLGFLDRVNLRCDTKSNSKDEFSLHLVNVQSSNYWLNDAPIG